MKTETVKKVGIFFAFLGWVGVVVISFAIGFGTRVLVVHDAFSLVPLYVLVLYYGLTFGAVLVMMAMVVANIALVARSRKEINTRANMEKGVEVE